MKNLSLVLNGILAIAVAVLYYFQFAAPKPEVRKNTVDAAAVDSVSSKLKIAYVNTDSLWDAYKLINDIQTDLEAERAKAERKVEQRTALLEKQLEQMAIELQNKMADFESKGRTMNETLRNMKMEELQSLQANAQTFSLEADQEVTELRQSLQNDLLEKELKGTKKVQDNIKAFLKEYNQDYDFTYVLAYSSEAGGILLGNPALDITKDVVAGLNETYDAEQAAKAEAEGTKK
ncbi:MAG: OmpH family outer membrane protein [Flavobacteriales bacterium]|nr:OmpH family outer membrane protein [Flavobacteriales bacterium]